MTCIVGIADGKNVWIGGDSAAVDNRYALRIKADQKVFHNGDFIFGFTSSFRMGQLIRFSFNPPVHQSGIDICQYIITDFIDALRECLKDGGYAQKHSEQEKAGTFLIGYRGRLFLIDDDYQVAESATMYNACGCGDHIALGAMYSTADQPPEERIITALKAAEQFSAGVRAPFHIVSDISNISSCSNN